METNVSVVDLHGTAPWSSQTITIAINDSTLFIAYDFYYVKI